MSRIRECFVCGTLLATTERQRVEVRHKREKLCVAEVCQSCWWKLRGLVRLRVVKNGKTYEVEVRKSQMSLFGRTAQGCIGRRGRHG